MFRLINWYKFGILAAGFSGCIIFNSGSAVAQTGQWTCPPTCPWDQNQGNTGNTQIQNNDYGQKTQQTGYNQPVFIPVPVYQQPQAIYPGSPYAQQQLLQQQRQQQQSGQVAGQSLPPSQNVGSNNGGIVTNGISVDPSVYKRGQTPGVDTNISKMNSGGIEGTYKNQLIKSNARQSGIQIGYAEEIRRLNNSVIAQDRKLSNFYNFERILIDGVIVPPVITEIRKYSEKVSNKEVVAFYGSYQVLKEAKLTINFPSWRDYLILGTSKASGSKLAPNDSSELRVWKSFYRKGYNKGVKEARATFSLALNKLDRDYRGMLLYHRLAKKGAVSIPYTSSVKKRLKLIQNGKGALVKTVRLRLHVNTKFKNNAKAFLSEVKTEAPLIKKAEAAEPAKIEKVTIPTKKETKKKSKFNLLKFLTTKKTKKVASKSSELDSNFALALPSNDNFYSEKVIVPKKLTKIEREAFKIFGGIE